MEIPIRPSAVGKKIWLFIEHPKAGCRSQELRVQLEELAETGNEVISSAFAGSDCVREGSGFIRPFPESTLSSSPIISAGLDFEKPITY